MSKKKICKNICKFCSYRLDEDRCSFFYKDVQNCVTGDTDRVYDDCIKHNKCGCCKMYLENEQLVQEKKLLDAINKYKTWEGYVTYTTRLSILINELKYVLEKDTKYSDFYEISDYDGVTLLCKYDESGSYTKHYKKLKEEIGE